MAALRVTGVDVREFAVDLAAPLSTARGDIDRREGLLVRVSAETDGERVTGVGEATPLPGWTEPLADCRAALAAAADRLPGTALADDTTACVDAPDGTPAARHGLALAAADCRARHEGDPLWTHLRAESGAGTVRVNATVGDGDPAETVERAHRAVERGFDCLKVKVGARPVAGDLDRLGAVRRAVGDGVTLRADANAAWDRETARRFLDGVAQRGLDLDYVEQPVAADGVGELVALRERERGRSRGRQTGIAADESVVEAGHGTVLDAGAADAVVLKPMTLGGPSAAVDAASDARRAGVTPVVTTTVDAVVARTAAVHVAAAVEAGDGDGVAHGLATADRLAEDLAPDPAPVDGGRVRVPAGPGTGVDPGVFES